MLRKIGLQLVLAACVAHGQAQGALTYTEVVAIDSASKSQLFERARRWFNDAFRDSGEVLNIQDKESGELSGKGRLIFSSDVYNGSVATKGDITFRITVLTKDGRYKYEITDFMHEGNRLNKYGAASFGLITSDQHCPYEKRSVWPGSQVIGSADKWLDNVWLDIKSVIDVNMQAVVSSLNEDMQKPAGSDSEW